MQSNFYVFDGIAVQVIEDTTSFTTKLSKEVKKGMDKVAVAGGFISLQMPAELKALINEVYAGHEEASKPTNFDGVVICLRSAVELLTDDEKLAMIHHELAHIKNGDIFTKEGDTLEDGSVVKLSNGLMSNVYAEHRADMAGVSVTSAEVMASAIRKIQFFYIDYLFKFKDNFMARLLKKIPASKVVRTRLSILDNIK